MPTRVHQLPWIVVCGFLGLACGPAPAGTNATVPPSVEIELPADGAHSRTQMVLVRGRAIGVAELFLNTTRVNTRPDGSFEQRIELSGPKAEIVARDGKRPDSVLCTRHVTIDLDAPMLELVDLPGESTDGALYRRSVTEDRVVLRGRATDAAPGEIATITIGEEPCVVEQDGRFELTVDAPTTGERTLEIEVKDRAFNRARILLTLVRR